MSLKEAPLPKALNIIRPSLPSLQHADSSQSSSTMSSSTLSTLDSFSNARVQPTIVNPSNFAFYQNNWASFKSTNPVTSTVGVNAHRLLHRARSNSNLSKSTFFSNLSLSSFGANSDEGEDIEEEDEEEEDLNDIDGLTDEEEEEEEEETPTTVVAKIKHGTIMNGKGEFVNKGSLEDHNPWLDEARANRKIADLEIEKASLLVLNTTLEAKLRQQTARIVELQNRLQMNEEPLTPISDKHMDDLFDDNSTLVSTNEDEEIENDQVFQRIRFMLEDLILQAELALLQKSKQSGKVLQHDFQLKAIKDEEKKRNVQDTLYKLTVRSVSPSPTALLTNSNNNNNSKKRPPVRRVSASFEKPASAKMSRNLSRQSSPPVMVTSHRPFSPPPTPQKSSSPRYPSLLRKASSQDLEKPKWHF